MSKQPSLFTMPRKELISSVQKGVFVLLFLFLVAAIGCYKFFTIEVSAQSDQQARLMALISRTHAVEGYWYQLLLLNKNQQKGQLDADSVKRKDLLYTRLAQTYQQIDQQLKQYQLTYPNAQLTSSKSELDLLKKMTNTRQSDASLERLFSAKDETKIEGFIGKSEIQSRRLSEQFVLQKERNNGLFDGEWWLFVVFSGLAVVLIILSVGLVKRLEKGFYHLHIVLEKHKQGGLTVDNDYQVLDEFTDVGHLFDNELSSREFSLSTAEANTGLLSASLTHLTSAFLVVDNKGDVRWMSGGFRRLWDENTPLFESLFEIDPGLDDPLGEQMPEAILAGEHDVKLSLLDGRYALSVENLTINVSAEEGGVIVLSPLSQLAEIAVLRNSLELMVSGSWHYPIRILREDSAFKDFSELLENVRAEGEALMSAASEVLMAPNSGQQITKLQQIKTLLLEKINDNHDQVPALVAVEQGLSATLIDRLNSLAELASQVDDNALAGYELLVQQLALIEKDMSAHVLLLRDVDRWLNEVRSATLSALAKQPITDSEQHRLSVDLDHDISTVQHRLSVDLDHDISTVQQQISDIRDMAVLTHTLLETDHSVSAARLLRARTALLEINEHIVSLLALTGRPDRNDQVFDVLTDNTDELDSF